MQYKFRVWHEKRREMCDTGFGMKTNVTSFDLTTDDDRILMQFTGLLDADGKEIYEGDIVEVDGHPYYVELLPGGFRYFMADQKNSRDAYTPWLWMGDAADRGYVPLIIGNIHENPELLA